MCGAAIGTPITQVDRSREDIVHRQARARVGHVHELRAGDDVEELAGRVTMSVGAPGGETA